MTLENTRLDRAFAVLDALQQTGSPADRVSAAFHALDGIELTGASDAVRNSIESFGMKYNAMQRGHLAESSETPAELSDEEAHERVIDLRQVAELIRDTETERILDRFRDHGGVLPEAEVIEARRHREWFASHLIRGCYEQIEKLKRFDDRDAQLDDDQHNTIPFLAFFLFSEWSVEESVPVILESLRLPGKGPYELFGDAANEHTPHYLAQFLSHDLDRIDELIADPQANTYVRWSAASSYKLLVRDQLISLDDAVARLDRLFHKIKIVCEHGHPSLEHQYELSAGLLSVICSIGGASRSTFSADEQNWDFVEESIIDRDTFVEYANSTFDETIRNRMHRLPPTRIEDALECVRDWAAFSSTPTTPPPRRIRVRPTKLKRSGASGRPAAKQPGKRGERVPRNAKCPCGSGRKHKQCCLRREN